MRKPEYVICAAVHYQDGNEHEDQPRNIETGLVVGGLRHNNCMQVVLAIDRDWDPQKYKMGFITSYHRFLDRQEAMVVAIAAGQVPDDETNRGHDLISEDLY